MTYLATATGGGPPDPSLRPSSVAAPTPEERDLLAILRRHQGRANAITQEAAGREMGFGGHVDTIRRRVQKVRESAMRRGYFICASSTAPAGMWLPVSDAEIDEYYEQVKCRAVSSLRTAAMADRLRGRRMLEEIQEELDLAPEEIAGESTEYTRVGRACVECGSEFVPEPGRALQQFYCSPGCRYTSANRRRHA